MQASALDVLIAAFSSEGGAEDSLEWLLETAEVGRTPVKSALTLRKDCLNNLHIVQRAPNFRLGGAPRTAVGVTADRLVRQWLGETGTCTIAERMVSGSFLEEARRLGAHLPPGWSALVAVVEHTNACTTWRALKDGGLDFIPGQEEQWALSSASMQE